MKIGEYFPFWPNRFRNDVGLTEGLHCAACDAPLGSKDDPELCRTCMGVVLELNQDLKYPGEDEEDV